MDAFTLCYTVLGGLGVFFYGMKSLSDAMQAIAGDMIKNIINTLTTNSVLAVLVGTSVTMLVQSSSVTTVMIIGLVNAGLMKLTQAIGVIFGANIGTTITGWIISIKVGKYGLLFVGLGVFPMLFGRSDRWRQIGRAIFGIGMVFFGLEIMSSAFKPLGSDPGFLNMISFFSGQHYGAYIASVAVGCLLTMIVQSSSAMLGITMAMAAAGTITFNTAAALVLGENIGTTITALLASVGANVNAKRAAKAHSLFNVCGVFIVMLIFPYYVSFIEWFVPGDANFVATDGTLPNIGVHIATGHTLFNLSATILFLPFINVIAKIVTRLTPDKEHKEVQHLVMLGNPVDIMPVTALVQAETEVVKMKSIVDRMFKLTREYLELPKLEAKMLNKIKDYERITDNIQKEVTVFICKLLERSLSEFQSVKAQNIVRIVDEIESVADYLDRLVSDRTRGGDTFVLVGESRTEFFDFFNMVKEYYDFVVAGLIKPAEFDMSVSSRRSIELHALAVDMRSRHLFRATHGEYQAESALVFSDMVVSLRKVRSHVLNISQAIDRTEKAKRQRI